MKKVKQALTLWSKEAYGNIFQKISTLEDVIKVKEIQMGIRHSGQNREELHRAQADLRRYMSMEEDFWRQKAGMNGSKEGDKNTKFFHSYVTGRRNKLSLQRIQNCEGDWVTEKQQRVEKAVSYFQKQFSEEKN